MTEFVWFCFRNAGTKTIPDAHSDKIWDIFQSHALNHAPYCGFCHLIHVIVEKVLINKECRVINDIFWKAEPLKNFLCHARANMIVVIERCILSIPMLCSWLANIMQKSGEAYGEFF